VSTNAANIEQTNEKTEGGWKKFKNKLGKKKKKTWEGWGKATH